MRSISLFFRSVAKPFLLILFLNLTGILIASGQDVSQGATLFKSNCASCHQLDRRMTGPALKGVNDRREEAWLLKWIKNSPAMVASGDPAAVQIFNEYNKTPMPAFPMLSEGDIKSILAYIKAEGDKPAATATTTAGGTAAPA